MKGGLLIIKKEVTGNGEVNTAEHWVRVKKARGGKTVYLRYCGSDGGKRDFDPEMFVNWEVQDVWGGIIERNRVGCRRKDCELLLLPEEMVQIVFGHLYAGLTYREVSRPLYVCG